MSRLRLLAVAAFALVAVPASAFADDAVPQVDDVPPAAVYAPAAPPPGATPPPEVGPPQRPLKDKSDLHTFLEARLGTATFLNRTGYGPMFTAAYGLGWTWIDVGAVAGVGGFPVNDADAHATQYSLGLELATRTSLGGVGTFRFGLDPLYTLESYGGSTHSLVGVDALAQVLFTVDDSWRPAWRVGVGFHGGRRWPTSGGDGNWMVGVDLIVRAFW